MKFWRLVWIGVFVCAVGLVIANLNEPKLVGFSTGNIIIEENVVDFDSMTLQQKIGQMIMVRGDSGDLRFNEMNVGGIFLDRQNSEEEYAKLIGEFQDRARIRLLVSTDLEGAWIPFPDKDFPLFSDIEDVGEAYDVGFEHGILLHKVGFNLNFAPIAEYNDKVYGGRVFVGDVGDKVAVYISGLQENVFGTCKHYPGQAMNVNLHNVSDEAVVSESDLDLFDVCLDSNVGAIMVSHQIVSGAVDSFGRPSSVSEEVIDGIAGDVLVVADEVNMRGLSMFYSSKVDMYVDLINAGENLILDFDLDVFEFEDLVGELEGAVLNGRIEESRIDESVLKILKIKGIGVVDVE